MEAVISAPAFVSLEVHTGPIDIPIIKKGRVLLVCPL